MDKDILRPTPQIWDAVAEDYTIELADSDRELASEIMRVFQKNGIIQIASQTGQCVDHFPAHIE